MIYNNLLFFLVVIFTITTDTPPEHPGITPVAGMAILLATYVFFNVSCAWLYKRAPKGSVGYFSAEQKSTLLAVGLFVTLLHGIDLKYYLHPLSFSGKLPVLENIGCLFFFYLFLVMMWSRGRPYYIAVFRRHHSVLSLVITNTRANLPIIMPWLAISLVFDFLAMLDIPVFERVLASPYGDLAIFLIFVIFLLLLFPPLVRWLWNCKPLPESFLREEIKAFCRTQNFSSEILVWPLYEGQVVTAAVMGIIPGLRYLLVTPALLNTMNKEELEAVLAHEIGHVKKKHLILYVLLFLGFSIFAGAVSGLLPFLFLGSERFYDFALFLQISPENLLIGLIGFSILTLMLLYFRFLFGYFIRNFERQADLYVFKAQGHSGGLVSSFEKIALLSGKIRDKKSWHHFGIGERIDFLKRCEVDRSLIRRHDKKVYLSLAAYCFLIVFSAILFARIDTGQMAIGYETRYMEAVIMHKLHQEPENGLLFLVLGNILQEKEMEQKAVAAYERALVLKPDHPDIHNNLAWLLLTARDESLLDPEKALQLAKQAANLKEEGYILDTLAVALWANGFREKAIEAELRAVAIDPKNKTYYTKQAEKIAVENWQPTP